MSWFPDAELTDAAAYLTEIHRVRPKPRRRTRREQAAGWRLFALLAGLVVMPEAGWLVLGARDRMSGRSALRPLAILVVALILGLMAALALLIVVNVGGFIDAWLIHPRF